MSVDFEALLAELAAMGPVPVDDLRDTAAAYVDDVTIGAITVGDAFGRALWDRVERRRAHTHRARRHTCALSWLHDQDCAIVR